MYLKLSRKPGWKPHVIYTAIGVTRSEFDTWAEKVFPHKKLPYYSTYDFFIFMLIKQYRYELGIELKRIKLIKWNDALEIFLKHRFSGMKNMIFNINLDTNVFELYKSLNDFDHSSGINNFVETSYLIKELFDCFDELGL